MIKKKFFLLIVITLSFLQHSKAQRFTGAGLASGDSIRVNYLLPNKISLTDSLVNYGKMFLNTPYRYGSGGDTTFDCSGFTSYVYRNFGYQLDRSSAEQARQFDPVKRADLKTGDLVFFSGRRRSKHVGHVGIVVSSQPDGSFDFIHASVHDGVIISNSNEDYYRKRFLKANRVIESNSMLAESVTKNGTIRKEPSDNLIAAIPSSQTRKVIPAEYHRVKKGETLSSIAHDYDLSIAELKNLNHLRSNKINPKQPLKVKDQETVTVVETLHYADNEPSPNTQVPTSISVKDPGQTSNASFGSLVIHLVQKGETLFSISNLYHITIDQLKKWNNIDQNNIRPGQHLKIEPAGQPSAIIATPNTGKETTEKTSTLATTKQAYTTPAKENTGGASHAKQDPAPPAPKTMAYRIKRGESLYSIAKANNVSVDQLKQVNSLGDNSIKAGQTIQLPFSNDTAEQVSVKGNIGTTLPTIQHNVEAGESYYSIARRFGCSANDIKKWNHKTDNKIKPGEKLMIHSK